MTFQIRTRKNSAQNLAGRKNHSKLAEGKRNIWSLGEEEKDFGSHEVKKELQI
jgi:hypothetical protein